ncbi:O-methyltransferase [Acaricomes phytoseiuli]|uniref:O-methyltransferase n=1 Tax=Acaricomes phytoseiuli TaxID=291968 RepID=UPI000378AF02|nr:O-methyltransferase [Acaricomes phytoseiuli]MCW1249048.1 O-methyltransferase [Acaricomes phytoseiuli]
MSADKTAIWSYIEGLPIDDEILIRARERSSNLGAHTVSAATGSLLSVLAATSKAQTVVEIGAGAGVSGIYLLRGLPRAAVLTSIDADIEHLRAAKEAFAEAGFPANRTRTISGRAAEVLPRLTDQAYDLVFINGGKKNYPGYVEQGIRLLKSGGLMVLNDALDGGKVAEPAIREQSTVALRQIGKALREDERLVSSLLPTGEGVLLAVKL